MCAGQLRVRGQEPQLGGGWKLESKPGAAFSSMTKGIPTQTQLPDSCASSVHLVF